MPVKSLRNARVLRRVPLFERCSRRELAEIGRIGFKKEFSVGEELAREGEAGQFFYVLLEGTVDVHRGGVKIATRSPGEFVGEVALLGHSARTATVTASSPVRALVINDRAFRSLIGRQPHIQLKVLEALAERV